MRYIVDNSSIAIAIENQDLARALELIQNCEAIDDLRLFGLPILIATASLGLYDLTETVLKQGANPNISIDQTLAPVSMQGFAQPLIGRVELSNLLSLGHKTPLLVAIKQKNLKMALLLLKHGACPNQQDLGFCSSLHWACALGQLELASVLLDFGANPNLQDMALSTPLHEAVRRQHRSIVLKLLENQANPTIEDLNGDCALSLSMNAPSICHLLTQSLDNLKKRVLQ